MRLPVLTPSDFRGDTDPADVAAFVARLRTLAASPGDIMGELHPEVGKWLDWRDRDPLGVDQRLSLESTGLATHRWGPLQLPDGGAWEDNPELQDRLIWSRLERAPVPLFSYAIARGGGKRAILRVSKERKAFIVRWLAQKDIKGSRPNTNL